MINKFKIGELEIQLILVELNEVHSDPESPSTSENSISTPNRHPNPHVPYL